MSGSQAPALVIEGVDRSLIGCAYGSLLLIPLSGLLVSLVVPGECAPWIADPMFAKAMFRGMAIVSGIFLAFVHVHHWQACCGRVEFRDDGVHFTKEDPFSVGWEEILGFRDESRWFVQLLRKSPRLADLRVSRRLAIPTLTERDRKAVLDLLLDRGLRRVE